jgi:hypothetical protein
MANRRSTADHICNGVTFYVKDLVVVRVDGITFHGKINGFFTNV